MTAVATTREEIAATGGGARSSARRLEPDVAIVVDVTHATDYPGIDKRKHGDYRLGGGPDLSRGASVSEIVFELLVEAAEAEGIPYTIEAASRDTHTDAEAIFNAHRGVATGLVSVPNRYMHSPNEMVALEDLDRTARLLAAFVRRLAARDRLRAALTRLSFSSCRPHRSCRLTVGLCRSWALALRRSSQPLGGAATGRASPSAARRHPVPQRRRPQGRANDGLRRRRLGRRVPGPPIPEVGLQPAAGGWFQSFTVAAMPRSRHAQWPGWSGKNVIGILPGRDPVLRNQTVILGAHYDHLGLGGFGSLDPDSTGKVHNGADDNASGMADADPGGARLAASPPARTVVFIAFSGEELGLLGSAYYVKEPIYPLAGTLAMINLDMVGRLRNGRLIVYGAAPPRSFPPCSIRSTGMRDWISRRRATATARATSPRSTQPSGRCCTSSPICTRTITAPQTTGRRSTSTG